MSELEADASPTDLKQTAKDLFAGAAGGIAQVLIGQPFDIVKVRLQTTQQYTSALDCATKLWKNEGPLAFYKGTLTPLIGIGACVSIQFGGFHAARRFFETRNAASTASGARDLSYSQYYAAGAIAGVSNTALSAPIEHVRIRLQTQPSHPRLYAGPLACIRALSAHAGVARGLFRGTPITLAREAQAYGCWFLTYEFLMNADVRRRGLSSRADVEAWRLALYGGLAGEMLWLGSYPLDVVKSKMQTDGLGAPRRDVGEALARHLSVQRYASTMDCVRKILAEEGLRGFWRGIGPTLLRAMPVSGATFFVAEKTLQAIS